MSVKVDISESRYSELKKNPLLFLRYYENIRYDEKGHEHDYSKWESIDRDLNISFDAGNFANRNPSYCLVLAESAEPKINEKGDIISGVLSMSIKNILGDQIRDWFFIINSFILKYQNRENNKYSFIELLWALDKLSWSNNTLISCIRGYSEGTIPFIIAHLNKLGRCLSLNKQNQLKYVCESVGGKYSIFFPRTISDLYRDKRFDTNLNLFQHIDKIFEIPYNYNKIKDFDESNQIIAIYKWLNSEFSLYDYNILRKPIYAMVSEETRLSIIKRYFHDIRIGHTSLGLNCDILSKLKDSEYEEFIRYRHCLETPAEPIILTVPLLCDSLITFYNTNGNSFQSFDGVLDFAMTHCDTNNPGINFKLERILPTCENGAVFNEQFKGFIDYSIVTVINYDLLTDENLENELKHILDGYGKKRRYFVCRMNNNNPIPDDILENCKKNLGKQSKECLSTLPYDDKWEISGRDKVMFINTFLSTPFENIVDKQPYSVDWEMLSLSKFKEYIVTLPDKFEKVNDKEFVVPSYSRDRQSLDLYLIEIFGKKLRMRFFPQGKALVSMRFDVFGIKKRIFSELSDEDCRNSNSKRYEEAISQYQTEEAQEVCRRTTESLQKELNISVTSEGFFEVGFDSELFYKIIRKYYYKSTIIENDQIQEKQFLKDMIISGYKPFCAPKLAEAKNVAISLPFFWCRGKECFHNNLAKQTLEEQYNWKEYSLFHMIEILDYPKLKYTECGYEPDEVIRRFIAITNKVMQKFRRLKCRACGHMLFSGETIGFNRYNYYGCANPNCAEYRQPVYLNYCYHCKKGLIDSRDSKRCPNGWYICPTCLSCCDDAQYERLAQKYVLDGKQIPQRIKENLGHGHNDKGIYYCPQCGGPIEIIYDGQSEPIKGCLNCRKKFDVTI